MADVGIFDYVVLEPSARILLEFQKKPPQSKAELEATAPVPACKSHAIILERSTKEAPDTYILGQRGVGRGPGRSKVIAGYSNQRLCERFDQRNVHLRRCFEL